MTLSLMKNLPEFTVSELSSHIKIAMEGAFPYVRVRGEISGCKSAPSGHMYLNLKDEHAVLGAICWRGNAAKFAFKPEDGLEVIASGNITTYPGQSKYQIIIDSLEPAGLGALMALLDKRKKKLESEGLFASNRKKAIPYLPQVIGVITSPTGAVIKDILHRIADRFPTRVIVWPVLVQGDKAAGQIAAAINGFNSLKKDDIVPRPDVLIIARGGGSIEDLWAFNEEVVVRAVSASNIPIISAVGHETDVTLIDYVADLRAPTPSAAAEMAVPVKSELIILVDDLAKRSLRGIFRLIEYYENTLKSLERILPDPGRFVAEKTQKFDGLLMRMDISIQNLLKEKQQKMEMLARLLQSYHYKQILARGFALLRDENGRVIKSASLLLPGKNISIELADGNKDAVITGAKLMKSKNATRPGQGSLF